MVKNEKVFELKIEEDDDVSGIDSISLVDEPAIEVNWVAFAKEKEHDFHIPDGEDDMYLDKLFSKGQPEQDLLDEGWVIDRIETVKENFATAPNDISVEDTEFYRVRYKYSLSPNIKQSAIIATTRQFCKQLINKNYVWRVEEIESEINSFGQSAQFWRGGWNCRHQWYRIFYKRSGDITNKASANKNKITVAGFPVQLDPEWIQPDTVTNKTAANPSKSTVKNLGLAKEKLDIEPNPCWEGYEPIGLNDDGSPRCVPIKEEMGLDVGSITPYVDQIGKKKKKVISKPLVEPTTFLDEFEYLLPKQDMSKQHFAVVDDEKFKKIVLGPAMIPNQKIFRKDEFGRPYYVFFSPDTIKMIAEKYMRNKLIDNNDQMHDGKAVKDVHVLESWIKESENDKSTDYGYSELPVGTWFVSMKVNNGEIWDKVKSGKLNGFSVSGFFSEVAAFSREEMFLYKVAEVLKKY
jgi:hypothetical protein